MYALIAKYFFIYFLLKKKYFWSACRDDFDFSKHCFIPLFVAAVVGWSDEICEPCWCDLGPFQSSSSECNAISFVIYDSSPQTLAYHHSLRINILLQFDFVLAQDENELENGTNSKTQSPFEKCQSSTSISICYNPKNKSSPNYFLNESKAEYDCETASWKLTLNRKATDQIFFQANLKESNSSCQHQLNLKYQESQVNWLN